MAFLDSRLSLSLDLYIAALTVPPRPLFVLLGCVGVQSTVSTKKKGWWRGGSVRAPGEERSEHAKLFFFGF